MADIEFKANGYLEKTYLDREGGKHITFEFSNKDALEIAKLELMGRDLNTHSPILLKVTVKVTLIEDLENAKSGNGSKVIR